MKTILSILSASIAMHVEDLSTMMLFFSIAILLTIKLKTNEGKD
jgi:hypothetical protein